MKLKDGKVWIVEGRHFDGDDLNVNQSNGAIHVVDSAHAGVVTPHAS